MSCNEGDWREDLWFHLPRVADLTCLHKPSARLPSSYLNSPPATPKPSNMQTASRVARKTRVMESHGRRNDACEENPLGSGDNDGYVAGTVEMLDLWYYSFIIISVDAKSMVFGTSNLGGGVDSVAVS